MSSDVTRLDLRLRLRGLFGYAAGMAAYTLIVVALYPTFKGDHSLDVFAKKSSTMAALFGANGPLTTPPGWLNANLYGNFVPLVALLLCVGYGAHSIAGQNEDGTLAVVAMLPLTRRSILVQKFATLCLVAVPTSLATLAAVLAGRGFQLSLPVGHVVGVTVGALLLGIDFGALAMLIGALTGSRAVALGITSTVAAATYLISSLAPLVHWLHPARVLSPFYWAVGNGQIASGLSVGSIVVLVVTGLVLLAATMTAFERLDVH